MRAARRGRPLPLGLGYAKAQPRKPPVILPSRDVTADGAPAYGRHRPSCEVLRLQTDLTSDQRKPKIDLLRIGRATFTEQATITAHLTSDLPPKPGRATVSRIRNGKSRLVSSTSQSLSPRFGWIYEEALHTIDAEDLSAAKEDLERRMKPSRGVTSTVTTKRKPAKLGGTAPTWNH
jgi:hypothetical protein